LIITELGVFEVDKQTVNNSNPHLARQHLETELFYQQNSLTLIEIADVTTVEEVKAKTDAEFTVSPDLQPMRS